MNRTITVVSVRKSIKVAAAPDRAFHVFTAGMSRWWLKSHSINKSPIKDIVIEPEARGRWFARGEDGSECEGGKVLAWEPPVRLPLANGGMMSLAGRSGWVGRPSYGKAAVKIVPPDPRIP